MSNNNLKKKKKPCKWQTNVEIRLQTLRALYQSPGRPSYGSWKEEDAAEFGHALPCRMRSVVLAQGVGGSIPRSTEIPCSGSSELPNTSQLGNWDVGRVQEPSCKTKGQKTLCPCRRICSPHWNLAARAEFGTGSFSSPSDKELCVFCNGFSRGCWTENGIHLAGQSHL